LKSISGKTFAKCLERRGWVLQRIRGSHHIYSKDGTTILISIPIHGNKPLKRGLLKYFMKIANIQDNEL